MRGAAKQILGRDQSVIGVKVQHTEDFVIESPKDGFVKTLRSNLYSSVALQQIENV